MLDLLRKHRMALLAVVAFYSVFGLLYFLALYFNWMDMPPGQAARIAWRTALDYVLKAVWTLPFWYMAIVLLRDKSLMVKGFFHLIGSMLYVICWLWTYHRACEAVGLRYLTDGGMVWDLYIPILFYLLQFGFFHAFDAMERLQQEQLAREQMRELAHASEVAALKAQVQPHFLFNTLNSISASVPPASEETRMLIAQLADTFRYALSLTARDTVPLREEFAFLASYLALEQTRFSDRLTIRLSLDPVVSERLIAPLLLQPLVENALKHGIAPQVEGGAVEVLAFPVPDGVRIEVRDTGAGWDAVSSGGHGLGLANVRQRLNLLYGTSLHLAPNHPHGCIAAFTLPAV